MFPSLFQHMAPDKCVYFIFAQNRNIQPLTVPSEDKHRAVSSCMVKFNSTTILGTRVSTQSQNTNLHQIITQY